MCRFVIYSLCVIFLAEMCPADVCKDKASRCKPTDCSVRPGYALERCQATCGKCSSTGVCVDSQFYPCARMTRYAKSCSRRLRDFCPKLCGLCTEPEPVVKKLNRTVWSRLLNMRLANKSGGDYYRRAIEATLKRVDRNTESSNPSAFSQNDANVLTTKAPAAAIELYEAPKWSPNQPQSLARRRGVFATIARLPVYYEDNDYGARSNGNMPDLSTSPPTTPIWPTAVTTTPAPGSNLTATMNQHCDALETNSADRILKAVKLLACRDKEESICSQISDEECFTRPGYYLTTCPLFCRNCLGVLCLDSTQINCSKIVQLGMCKRRLQFAFDYCPLSCELCPKATWLTEDSGNRPECSDVVPNCEALSKSGACDHPYSVEIMKTFCRKSCKLCEEEYYRS